PRCSGWMPTSASAARWGMTAAATPPCSSPWAVASERPRPESGSFCLLRLLHLRVPYLAVAAHHPAFDGQRLQAHRGVGVQAGGGDADLRAQAELAAVVEARLCVHHDRRAADRADEAVGRGLVGGADGFSMVGRVLLD